jgi:hypothetical protein
MQNTQETRRQVARTLQSAFGGRIEANMAEIERLPLAVSMHGEEPVAVCVLEIQAPKDAPTWGQVKYLATDGNYQSKGHGLAAMACGLRYVAEHAESTEFGLWADTHHEEYRSARLDPNRSAVSFYGTKCGMHCSDAWDPKMEDGDVVQQWMVGDVTVALSQLHTAMRKYHDLPRCHLVDPGAYNAVRCFVDGGRRRFELRYTWSKYGWSDHAIVGIDTLCASQRVDIDWATVEPRLAKMGIARQNIMDAMARPKRPVTLYAGARPVTGGADSVLEAIRYPQAQDGLEDDVMCTVKAGCSGLHFSGQPDVAVAMSTAQNERLKTGTVTNLFMQHGIGCEKLQTRSNEPSSLLQTVTDMVSRRRLCDRYLCLLRAVVLLFDAA